ncbi:FitA-like ribbon-helix-helix domain-containing protein [Reyranella sp.]|uniref:FitA-like ribbon-helix-helix domain-containing protein n=1 Tax=Reyranella sp. TaxID=1929291 RepID=UPI003BAB19F1
MGDGTARDPRRPEDLVLALEERAAASGRSVEAEHRLILEEALRSGRDEFRKRAARLRACAPGLPEGHRPSGRTHPRGSRLLMTIVVDASIALKWEHSGAELLLEVGARYSVSLAEILRDIRTREASERPRLPLYCRRSQRADTAAP